MNETPTWKTLEVPGKVILGGEMHKAQMSLEETPNMPCFIPGTTQLDVPSGEFDSATALTFVLTC